MRITLQQDMNDNDEGHNETTFIEMDESLPSCSLDIESNRPSSSDDYSPFHIVSELKKSLSNCYIPKTADGIDDIQPYSLNQFMDVLYDLDEVLDKTLEDNDSDSEDLVCKPIENDHKKHDDNSDVQIAYIPKQLCNFKRSSQHNRSFNLIQVPTKVIDIKTGSLGRVKSAPNILEESEIIERNDVRSSMRHVEPLTLPVLLFLEHRIGVTDNSPRETHTENLGPTVVGRHTLLLGADGASWERDACLSDRDTSIAQESVISSSISSSSEESPPPMASIQGATEPNEEESNEETLVEESPFGTWPHEMSSLFACLSCTLGMFNLSQFATYSVNFGANFILQFFILSLVIGLPLFTLYMCLGHTLTAGPIDMWKISPVFKGIGISLLTAQAVYGVYSVISVAWMLVYLRDSFIASGETYQWAMPYGGYTDVPVNVTQRIWDRVSYYFNEVVLQRSLNNDKNLGNVKFHLAFNLAVVWMVVVVTLSKGLRSYGKAIFVLISLPIIGMTVLCIRMVILTPLNITMNLFSNNAWQEFFLNSHSWAAAAQVTFLTWGAFGPSVMQIISHNTVKSKKRKLLQRQSLFVISVTCLVLLAGGVVACLCVELLKQQGFLYLSGSYENPSFWRFMYLYSEALPPWISSTPVRYMRHYSGVVGIVISRPGSDVAVYSGWQPLRLATELMPTTLAGNFGLTPVWAIIFYLTLILFGITQQLAIWHCVITGIMAVNVKKLKRLESNITFCSCFAGFAVGLLFTTNAGIRCMYWAELVCGAWWHAILTALMVCAALVIGRPLTGEALAKPILPAMPALAAVLAFTWNVALPVLLVALAIVDFRLGKHKQFYIWRSFHINNYWPLWSRRFAVGFQQSFIAIIPFVAFIQTWRYMSKGPNDILERAQNLYRPRAPRPVPPRPVPRTNTIRDPPPRYTPPPSYSTATGLRHALRRTVRRFVTPADLPATTENDQAPQTISEQISHTDSNIPIVAAQPRVRPALRRNSLRNSLRLRRDALRRSLGSASRVVNNARRALTARSLSTEHLVRHANIR